MKIEYYNEKKIALKELHIWKYLSEEEKDGLKNCPSEIRADNMVHKLKLLTSLRYLLRAMDGVKLRASGSLEREKFSRSLFITKMM